MKKIFCALLALALLCSWALAGTRIAFEDGFSLELPDGWLHYAPDEEMAVQGILYCLSEADAAKWLYIQSWQGDCDTVDELNEHIIKSLQPDNSGVYSFNGVEFVVYDLPANDLSCCATLLGGQVLNFVFTPQSDSDFMVAAAQIMNSFYLV